MSIDFTGVTAVQIPEGNVLKIARKSDGTVLWEKPASGDLPAGYTRLEYVLFTGKQTVDTGIMPDRNTKIEVVFEKTQSSTMYLYGVRTSNNTASVTAYLTSSGAWRFGNQYRNLTLSANVKYTTIQNKSGINVNGTLTSYSTTPSSFTAPYALTIGSGRTTAGGYGDPTFVGKVYDFKMYSNNVLTAEYIPCRTPGGVYGFWDKVSGSFKGSVTSTPLEGGNT